MKKVTFLICSALFATMFVSSCSKCKECTAKTSVKYNWSSSDPDFDEEFVNQMYPNVTNVSNLGEVCGDDLKSIDGETKTSTTTQTLMDMTATVEATTVYTCE